jgi:hypothetical protein
MSLYLLLLICRHSIYIVDYMSCVNYYRFRPFPWPSSGIYSFSYIHLSLWSALPLCIGQILENGSVYLQFYINYCVNSLLYRRSIT